MQIGQICLLPGWEELAPAAFETVKVTVWRQILVKVCEGFRCVDVPPSPKDQNHEAGEWAEVSLNVTVKGATPRLVLMVKEETGGVWARAVTASAAASARDGMSFMLVF